MTFSCFLQKEKNGEGGNEKSEESTILVFLFLCPIALIDPSCLTVALCTNEALFDKLWSNVMEVKARQGPLLAVVFQGEERFNEVADFVISIPKTTDELAAILASVTLQFFAFYRALFRGEDIDQPRNLAKSVTVE